MSKKIKRNLRQQAKRLERRPEKRNKKLKNFASPTKP